MKFLLIYVPNLRFNNDPYKKYNLYEFATRVTRKNKDNVSNLPLTISAQYGLVDQVSFFNKTVASKDMSGYYLLKNGEFAYNKSYSNDYPWGAIKRLDLYDMGCLSTLYICFKTNDNIVNSNYLVHYFESSKWHKQVADIAGEGARNHGLLNIGVNDFFNTKHAVPTIENQIKIAGFLDLIEKRIQTQIKIIDDLVLQKKYIISSLLKSIQDNEKIMLKDILFDYNIKTTINNEYPVLSSTASGMYLQSDYFNKETSSDNTIGYKIVPRGYCTYRSMSDTGLFTFNIQNLVEKGIVSPAYPVFSSNDDYINEFIILYLNNSSYIKKQILELKSGGTRFALPFSTLCTLKIPKLEKEKQLSLIKTITAFERKIENEEIILNALHQQKIFLLNNMFI
ncbi:restriction endonuclease subunit S [Holdemanella biformis]|uniref:restriction endonuclease subunit S n=1 Tax=Holdemanella biformis TaxID=1735 RepID=UPI001C25BBDA|nr:restriction endonuclease subunit S [Holdemanella biformis]MBU9896463.1 restriction endonuclease subunit S [Holdemanella biformis]MBV3417761.1 restriction endonuclease subunit S [Holdemanella biformis]